MRAAIYIRVSSDMQVDGYSLETQEDGCRRTANQKGWTIAATYRDEGISAKTIDRPAFQAMLADAEAGYFDVILVHKLDRFSRSVTDMLLTMRDLERCKVSVKSATEDFDFTTPIGRVLLTLLAAFAEWYLSNLSAETQRNRKTAAISGNWGSRLPFGYSPRGGWKRDGGEGVAIPDQNAIGYQMIMGLAETGEYSYRKLADALNGQGYRPTGRAGRKGVELWTTDSIRYMVNNRFYVGEVQYKGEWFPGNHEPLITVERWQAIQDIMASRQRVAAFKANRVARFYLLGGLLKCAECGSPMRGEYRTNNADKEYLYYRCSSRYRRVQCQREPFVRVEVIDIEVENLFNRFATMDTTTLERIEATQNRIAETSNAKPYIDQTQKLKRQLQRIKDLYELGDMDRSEYLEKRKQYQEELSRQTPTTSATVRRAISTISTIGEVWKIATPQERRKLVRLVVREVVVGESIIIHVRKEYEPFLIF